MPAPPAFLDAEFAETLMRGALDLAAMLTLVFGLYLRRYHDKTLVTVASMFNVFVFVLLSVLTSAQFSMTAGFGLFAVLALFTLRSEQISKLEITYFFGSVALAVICAVRSTPLPIAAGMCLLLLVCAWALDHPRLLQRMDAVKLTLDRIDDHTLSDPLALQAALSQRLGVQVLALRVSSMDYVNDLAHIHVYYRKP